MAELPLPTVSRQVIIDSLAFIDALAPTIDRLDREIHARAKADPRVKVLTALPGVGEFTAMVLLAEIGDISRFRNARALASWAGLTPTVRGSDLTVRHGHIWKAGLAVRAVGARAGRALRQTAPRVRRHLPEHRRPSREEDRHRRGGAQAVDPRLPPARRR
jgi:transposase